MTQRNYKSLYPLVVALVFVCGFLIARFIYAPHKSEKAVFSDKLNRVCSNIYDNYVDSLDVDSLSDMAITALMESLDPYSAYMPAVQQKEFDDQMQEEFEGIGIEFRMIDDTVHIMRVIDGGPSKRAGLLEGDRILKVDDKNIAGQKLSSTDIPKLIKGPKGTKVKLTIKRKGLAKPQQYTITRDVIRTSSIDAYFMPSTTTGYIRLSKFGAHTAEEFVSTLKKLTSKGISNLIVDLRGNGGGFMSAAITIADQFLGSGKEIVSTKGINFKSESYKATHNGLFLKGRLVILIDEFSASASEIVAGAVQDHDRGLIIGRHSFGKGTVQTPIDLGDGSALRLTIARYYTPVGRCIERPYDQVKNYDDILYQSYTENSSPAIDSTQQFRTPKGKILYGGGGITPDILVPVEQDSSKYYANVLYNTGIIFDYALKYTDNNRTSLLKTYPTGNDFIKHFAPTPQMLADMDNIAKTQGVTKSYTAPQDKSKIAQWLKAFIARNLYGENTFYRIYLKTDATYQKAIEVFRDNEAFRIIE